MQVSNALYIVMPVVITLVLFVLIALPFVGARSPGGSHSSGMRSQAQWSRGQIPDHSATPGAVDSDVTGRDGTPRVADADTHVPGVTTAASGDAARDGNGEP
jgi:hypothetical protein